MAEDNSLIYGHAINFIVQASSASDGSTSDGGKPVFHGR